MTIAYICLLDIDLSLLMVFPLGFNRPFARLNLGGGLLRFVRNALRAEAAFAPLSGCGLVALERLLTPPISSSAPTSRRTPPTSCARPISSRASRSRSRDGGEAAREQAASRSSARRRPPRRPRARPSRAGHATAEARATATRSISTTRPVANVAKVVLGDILGVALRHRSPRAGLDQPFVRAPDRQEGHAVRSRERAARQQSRAWCASRAAIASRRSPRAARRRDRRADPQPSVEPGYGMTVIPLQYVSGADGRADCSRASPRGPARCAPIPSGRLLLVVGTGDERQSALETVRRFDVDWMRGQSVGMYPVHNSSSSRSSPNSRRSWTPARRASATAWSSSRPCRRRTRSSSSPRKPRIAASGGALDRAARFAQRRQRRRARSTRCATATPSRSRSCSARCSCRRRRRRRHATNQIAPGAGAKRR